MLQVFRNQGIKNVVYAVVIVVVAFVFVLNFNPSAGKQTAPLNETCVVNVRGSCVTPKDFNGSSRLLMGLFRGQDRGLNVRDVRSFTREGLLERELLLAEAARLGISATEDEVLNELMKGYFRISVPTEGPGNLREMLSRYEVFPAPDLFDPKTKMLLDEKQLQQRIRMLSGRSATEFREEQRKELIASKVRDMVRLPIRISEAEALDSYLREKSTATVAFIKVRDNFASKYLLTVTDDEVAAFQKAKAAEIDKEFEARKADDMPKQGRVRHILAAFGARPTEKGGMPKPTEEQIKKAQARAAEAWGRLQKGEAFPAVARDLSEDPGSKDKGGGYDSMDGFVDEFKNAANALKPGETTPGAVETVFGYHIIMKDDPAKSAEAEAALKKTAARTLYLKEKAPDAAKALAQSLMASWKSASDIDSAVQNALKPYVKPAPTVPLIVRGSTPPDPGARGADGGAPIPAEAGTNAAGADAAAAPSAGDGGKPVAPAAGGKKDDKATKKDDKGADTSNRPMGVGYTADNDPDRPRVRTSDAFNQAAMFPVEGIMGPGKAALVKFAFSAKPGDILEELVSAFDGKVVVRLKEIKKATPEDFEKDRANLMQRSLFDKQQEALGLYIKRLRESAKAEIKVDEKFFRESDGRDGGAPSPIPDEE